VDVVIDSLEATLLNNLGSDGFTLKLNGFGKFSVRHKSGILRKIPFTGKTILTKDKRKVRFVSLGALRQGGTRPPSMMNTVMPARNICGRLQMLTKSRVEIELLLASSWILFGGKTEIPFQQLRHYL
jgi:nucleoid DNA-binding protein